jgi:serine/threonine-protein kinase RsbW
MATITLPARVESLMSCIAFVDDCVSAAGFPPKRVAEIELAVEEALTNICKYAYLDHTGEVEVRCTWPGDQHFLIEFIDTGQPFNPLILPSPDLAADLDQRQEGGLGVLLIRAMMDQVSYRREDNRNILQLAVQLPLAK